MNEIYLHINLLKQGMLTVAYNEADEQSKYFIYCIFQECFLQVVAMFL